MIASSAYRGVVKEFLTTTIHGAIEGKLQHKKVLIYNLDVIISVGYRVKSQAGTRFRQWATSVLKQYMLLGASVKDMGRGLCTIIKLGFTPEEILSRV